MIQHRPMKIVKTMIACFIVFAISTALYAIPTQQDGIERIVLNLTERPATSQAVTWRTPLKVSKPQAQIAPATQYTDLSKEVRTLDATTETLMIDKKNDVYYHSVVFDGLTPKTVYAYRVGDGKTWSEWNQFETAGQDTEPFTFINLGDPQNDIKSMCSRIFRAAYTKAPNAKFWHYTGDLISKRNDDGQWAEFFYALGWIPRMTPMIALPGNHGYERKILEGEKSKRITRFWHPQFTQPENGPLGLEETAYFIDYQGVRLVMLNGNEMLQEQAEWLDTILQKDPQRWTILAIHQPIYSTGKDRDNPEHRSLFVPIIDKHEVDLVFQGHDHTYGRSYKLKNGMRVDDHEKGTVYIVSVSGPKVYEINQRNLDLMVRIGAGRQLFQVASVDHNVLKVESYDVLGLLYDSVVLRK